MQPEFWHKKWESNVIGFHLSEPNPLLVRYFERLSPVRNSRIFVPLCGKTLDIGWLLSLGHRVVGVELSEMAVKALFESLNMKPDVSKLDTFIHYHAPNLDIFVGDIFNLSQKQLGSIDAVYDRGAFVALPEAMRQRYVSHLIQLTQAAPQLLISFEYDQSQLAGPPFATNNQEIMQHYQQAYDVHMLASESVAGGLKGQCDATEIVWLLKRPLGRRVFEAHAIKKPPRGRWKVMLPVLLLLILGAWLVYYYQFDAKIAAGGAVLVGFYSGLVAWLLGVISLVPVIGPLLVKVLTMSFIWLLNAIGYFVSYVAIRRGYSKDVITYRGLTIALIVGMVIGYVIGRL